MRYSLYLYLSRAFARVPDGAFLALAGDATIAKMCQAFSVEAVELQEVISSEMSGGTAEARLTEEFTRLFLSLDNLLVSPWESSYVPTTTAAAVRETYRSAGYESRGYPHEADDHIATELCFMAALAEDSLDACRKGDADRLAYLEGIQRGFLAERLNRWVCDFADAVGQVPDISPFFPALARFAALLCMRDPIL